MKISEDIKEQIKTIISTELKKRGFNVNLKMIDSENKGKYRLDFESDKFQTTPILFDEIYIKNSIGGYFEDVKDVDLNEHYVKDIFYHIDARYKTFDNGTNGVNLFQIHLRLIDSKIYKISIL